MDHARPEGESAGDDTAEDILAILGASEASQLRIRVCLAEVTTPGYECEVALHDQPRRALPIAASTAGVLLRWGALTG